MAALQNLIDLAGRLGLEANIIEALGTFEASAINEDKAFVINRINSADTINPDDRDKAIRLIRGLIRDAARVIGFNDSYRQRNAITREAFFLTHYQQFDFQITTRMKATETKLIPAVIDHRLGKGQQTRLTWANFTVRKTLAASVRGVLQSLADNRPQPYRLAIMSRTFLMTRIAHDRAIAVDKVVEAFKNKEPMITLVFKPTTEQTRERSQETQIQLMKEAISNEAQRISRRDQISLEDALQAQKQLLAKESLVCTPSDASQSPAEDDVIQAATEKGLMTPSGDKVRDFLIAISHLNQVKHINLTSSPEHAIEELDSMVTSMLESPVGGILSTISFQFPPETHFRDWKRVFDTTMKPIIVRVLESSLRSSLQYKIILNGTTLDQITAATGVRSFHFPEGRFQLIQNTMGISVMSEAFEKALSSWCGNVELQDSNKVLHDMKSFEIKLIQCNRTGCKNFKSGGKVPGVVNPYPADSLCTFRSIGLALYGKHHLSIKKGEKESPLQRLIGQDLCCLFYNCQLQDGSPWIPLILDVMQLGEASVPLLADKSRLQTLLKQRELERRSHGGVVHSDGCQKQKVDFTYESLKRLADLVNLNLFICHREESKQDWQVLCKIFADSEHADDAFLDYTYISQADGHLALITNLHNYGSETRCPHCNKRWQRNKDGHYGQDPTTYQQHVSACPNRRSTEVTSTFTADKVRYYPKNLTFEQLFKDQLQYETFISYDTEAIIGENGVHHPHTIVAIEDRFNFEFCYTNTSPSDPLQPTGNDVSKRFLNWLVFIAEPLAKKITNSRKGTLTKHQSLCKCKKADASSDCEKTCKYRKLNNELSVIKIPVCGYNSGRYDLTFLLNAIEKKVDRVLVQSSGILELCWSVYVPVLKKSVTYVFLDMFRHGGGSLETFASRNGVTGKKCPYSYDYIKYPAQYLETTFPTGIWGDQQTEKEARKIWDGLKNTSMKAYTEHYCRQDVELLRQAIKAYRATVYKDTGMEALSYVTISQLADNIFKKRYLKTTLHTIPSKIAYDLFNRSIFGGICQVFQHHAEATPSTKILGMDANSLYPFAMSRPLLTLDSDEEGKCKFEITDDPAECRTFLSRLTSVSKQPKTKELIQAMLYGDTEHIVDDLNTYEDGILRCLLDCDLYYTDEQMDALKHLPVLPTREVPPDNLGAFGNRVKKAANKGNSSSEMLLLTFEIPSKADYVLPAYVLLYLLINNMVTVAKVKKVIPMRFALVYDEYVSNYAGKRQEAANDVHKALETNDEAILTASTIRKTYFKSMLTNPYGKTLQDESKYTKEFIANNPNDYLKKLQGRQLVNAHQISKSTILVSCRAATTVKTPRYLGMSILWTSKLLMYDFIYNFLWKTYSHEQLQLLYIDTDGVYFKVDTPSYDAFLQRFPQNMRDRFIAANGDVTPGLFKLEADLQSLICLAPKLRSGLPTDDSAAVIKAKGVQKAVLKLNHEHFRQTLNDLSQLAVENMIFKKQYAKDGRTGVYMQTKYERKTLTMLDRKSVYLSLNESVPHGYYKPCLHSCNNSVTCHQETLVFCAICSRTGPKQLMLPNQTADITFWTHAECSSTSTCIVCGEPADSSNSSTTKAGLHIHSSQRCASQATDRFISVRIDLSGANRELKSQTCSHLTCDQSCGGLRRTDPYDEQRELTKMWDNWFTSGRDRCLQHGITLQMSELRAIAPKEAFITKISHLLSNHKEFSVMNYGTKWNLEHTTPVSSLWDSPPSATIEQIFSIENLALVTPEENSKLGGAKRKRDLQLKLQTLLQFHQ